MKEDATAKGKRMAKLIRDRAAFNAAAFEDAFGGVVRPAADRIAEEETRANAKRAKSS